MTFISYAQNGEDVVLWRALGHVEQGFYIDVGACDPDEDSVTKAFYERGWRGLNVEPERQYYERCVAKRPRDTNLNIAVTARSGIARFMVVNARGLSTTVDTAADAATAKGWSVETVEVPALSLADICATAGVGEIHFLKIDVEGGEKAVLEGADFEHFRPWIVVVEATVPNSTERNEHLWEDLLLRARYERVFFDGLNLYYVAQEHGELAERLAAPANVLDGYKHAHVAAAEQRIADLTAEAAAAQGRLEQLQTALEDLRRQHEAATALSAEQIEAREARIASLTADVAAAHRALDETRATLGETRAAAEQMRERTEALHAEVVRLEEVLVRTREAAKDEIEALHSQLAHQASSAQRSLEFATRRLAQSRRKVVELEDRIHAQQDLIEAIRDVLLPDARDGDLQNSAERLKSKLLEQAETVALLRARYEALEAAHADLRLHRDKILASNSWRVSAPLRKIRTAVRIARREPNLVMPLMISNLRRHQLGQILPLRLETSVSREPKALAHAAPTRASPAEDIALPGTTAYESLDHAGQVVALIRRDIAERRLARQ